MRNDDELSTLIKDSIIPGGGVIPGIHGNLLPPTLRKAADAAMGRMGKVDGSIKGRYIVKTKHINDDPQSGTKGGGELGRRGVQVKVEKTGKKKPADRMAKGVKTVQAVEATVVKQEKKDKKGTGMNKAGKRK